MSLRERTRRAVQAELVAAAQALILERGYEQVTVEQIAAAAGLSQRSFFRYFPSKEALVTGKVDLFGDQLVAALAARPADEPVWVSLRRMFDPVTAYLDDASHRVDVEVMQRAMFCTPSLRAGCLEAFDRIQQRVVDQLGQRWGPPTITLRAVVGAAFACLQAAVANRGDDVAAPVAAALDRAMAAVRPAGDP